jgi:predicted RNA binding protein YcfA (HicA-like mRNA interferase family)
MKRRDLERHLRQYGCVVVREGGNHTIYSSPHVAGTVPLPRHTEIKNVIVRAICRQLGIPSPI